MSFLGTLGTWAVAFGIVAVLTPIVRHYAVAYKLGDKPNGRKSHKHFVPHLGGIGLFIGVTMAAVVGFMHFGLPADGPNWVSALIPVTIIVALGLTDDLRNLKAREKLAVQIVAAVSLTVLGHHLIVGVEAIDSNFLVALLVSTVFFVGISSSVNLVDGHDGLAAGIAAISATAFATVGFQMADASIVVVSMAIIGACVAFLIYNFPPGNIFMGDTGSMFLGITLGLVACAVTMLQPSITTLIGVCLVLAVPMLDCLLAVVRRVATKEPIFKADNRHIHHVLAQIGFTPRQTILILYSIQATMAVLGVLVVNGMMVALAVAVVILVALSVGFYRLMVVNDARIERRAVRAELAANSLPSLEK